MTRCADRKEAEMTKQDPHTRITDRILAELEQGTRPWLKPWSGGDIAFSTALDSRASRMRCTPLGAFVPFSQFFAVRALTPVHFIIIFAPLRVDPNSTFSADAITCANSVSVSASRPTGKELPFFGNMLPLLCW
jgi:hypothetical protein